MPRVPAGDEDDGHQRASGTRSQTSGWPSWTRSPSAASQRMTWPAKGVRTSETPTRPTRSPTATAEDGSSRRVVAGPGQQARPGRLQGRLRAEDAAGGADHDPLGHVEVLALVQRRLGPPGAGRADLVHQRVEVLGLGDGQGLDLGQAALGQPAQHAAGPELDEGREPEAGEGLERLAPAHRAAQLGREQPGPLGGVVVHVRVHVGHHADLGGQEGHLGQRLAQVGPGALHQGRVEGARDLNRHDALRPRGPWPARRPGRPLRRCRRSRPGRARCSWPPRRRPRRACRPPRRRRRRCRAARPSSPEPPRRRGPWPRPGRPPGWIPSLEAEGAAGDQRGVLAEAVAGAGGRGEPDPLHRVEHDQAEHGRGQLRVLGLGQLLDRGVRAGGATGHARRPPRPPRPPPTTGGRPMAHPYRHVVIPVRGR